MDVRMPRVDGIEATRRLIALPQEGPQVIMLTTFDLDDYVYEALRAGASGFLLKDAEPAILIAGIRAVHAGESLLAPQLTKRMIEAFLSRRPGPDAAVGAQLAALTARERETLDLVAQGLSNAEIAATFVVAETTVKTHVARVLLKLGLRDRIQAVIYAYEHGLVPPSADDGR